MPAFGSSSKTGRLPSDKPRRAAGASLLSTGAVSRTSSQASSRTLSTPVASIKKDRCRDVRATSRASKRALAPATPSPTCHAPIDRTRAALPPGRDPPPSARVSEVSPARPPPWGSAEKKKAARLDEGVAAVRNLLFDEGPKTYCAVEEPHVSAERGQRSPDPSPVDPIDSIEAPPAPDRALALAPRPPFSSDRLPVDASIASSTRLTELRLADETWRRLAFRIARTGGTHGDALAASAREVFRRLAAALPAETETSARSARGVGTLARSPEGASRSRHLAPLLLDAGRDAFAESGERVRGHAADSRTRTVACAVDSCRCLVMRARRKLAKSLSPASSRGGPTYGAAVSRVARAFLASLACLALGAALASVVPLAAGDVFARLRPPAGAFERGAPPPS